MDPILDLDVLVTLGRVDAATLSPDGTWVAVAVRALDEDAAAFRSALWRVPVDGGPAERLLEGRFDDKAPAFRRDGALAFLSNRTDAAHGPDDTPDDESETQVWLRRADGTLERLTAEPLGVTAFRLARRADVLVVETPVLPGVPHDQQRAVAEDLRDGPSALHYTDMPVRHWDRWLGERSPHLVAFTDHGRRDLTPDRAAAFPEWSWDLSEDGHTVVWTERRQGVHRLWVHAVHAVEVATGAGREVAFRDDEDLYDLRLSPDGATIALVRNRWRSGEAIDPHLALLSLATGELRDLAVDWDVFPAPVGWTRDGGTLLVTADHRGCTPLFAVDAGTGARAVLIEEGTVEAVVIGEDTLIVRHSDLLHPPRLHRLDLRPGARLAPLADLAGLDVDLTEHLQVEAEHVSSSDGTPIVTRIVRPRAEGPHPGLLWIHGGPIGSWGDRWHWRWSAAVAAGQGYVVALPEPRGSTGFGHDHVRGIWGNVWGAACFQDVLAVADALEADPAVDADRLVAMGASFGGYMTNWLGTQTDRFDAIVTHAGLWDFQSFHGVTDHPAWWAFMMDLDPWEDDDLHRFSPRAHADGWTTPALILHGERDLRVPIGEALAQFEALRRRGVAAELVVFPDENHWIQKPRNILAWYEAWTGFLERTLG